MSVLEEYGAFKDMGHRKLKKIHTFFFVQNIYISWSVISEQS